MNIYLLTQHEVRGYDTYDAVVVYAKDEDSAKLIRPDSYNSDWNDSFGSWATSPEAVNVTYLGTTDEDEEGVILASFNAG